MLDYTEKLYYHQVKNQLIYKQKNFNRIKPKHFSKYCVKMLTDHFIESYYSLGFTPIIMFGKCMWSNIYLSSWMILCIYKIVKKNVHTKYIYTQWKFVGL